jgi:hypothetical protein
MLETLTREDFVRVVRALSNAAQNGDPALMNLDELWRDRIAVAILAAPTVSPRVVRSQYGFKARLL